MVPTAGERIRVHAGDITLLEVDAIVNAANERLLPGGGVCGAIHRAAGPALAAECASLGGCAVGDARLTRGHSLPASYVIHAVGPVWHGGTQGEDDLLASAYRSSLQVAREHGLRSVAFPAISTGIYGFPLTRATEIAVRTVREWLADEPIPETVVFAVFGAQAEAAYREALGVD